jgi:hypothetical protein
MRVSFTALQCALAAGLLLGVGCASRQRHEFVQWPETPPPPAPPGEIVVPDGPPPRGETLVAKASDHNRQLVVSATPPAPQVEVVGEPPGPDYVWIPGVWQWQGNWVWRSGHWTVRPRPNVAWIGGRWVRRNDGWVWIRGYWR